MDSSEGVADLHMHTTASDGTCSVEDRLTQALERDIEAIAITDHDTISGEISDRITHEEDIELIAGVEVRADVQRTKVELLGYYVDPADVRLRAVLEQVRDYRRERNRQIVSRLQNLTVLDQSYETVRNRAEGLLGRPHIANLLVKEEIVDSVGEAFGTYLGGDGVAFVPMERVPATEVLEAIQGAGGIVSLAHPGRVRTDDIEGIVAKLVAEGIDAIEVPYPYDSAPSDKYADVSVADAAEFAATHDLLWTGGSDCHGPDSGKFRIGDVRITRERLDALRQRAAERRRL